MSGSTTLPTTNTAIDTTASGMAQLPGRLPSHTTRRPRRPSLKSRPLVGLRNSRMPRMASGMMIDEMQMAAMPTASSQPKSRTIGTWEICMARKANTASKVTTSSAGPRPARSPGSGAVTGR